MDDKLKRRLAGAAVLLMATFVIVSLLPTPEQAAQQPDVDVVTIPLHEVVSHDPPPPAATTTPPTLAAPPPQDGDGTDSQEVDISGDDDGGGEVADPRKPVQLALDSRLQAGTPTEPARPSEKPAPAPATPKPAEKAVEKPADKAPEKAAEKAPEKAPEKTVAATSAKPAEKPTVAQPAPKPAEKAAEKPADKPAEKPVDKPSGAAAATAKPADKPATAAASWSVQVGGFADIGRARQVQDKLKELGQPSFLSPIDTPKGTLYRVRAGPYASREAAQAVLGKLNGGGFPDARIAGP